MSHGLGSMQRLLLQTVTTMLAEPTMGLFRQPRAACDHQQAPWYLTGPDAYTGTCLCRVVVGTNCWGGCCTSGARQGRR